MIRRLLGALALLLALGGCAAGATASADGPPDKAAMVCGEEIVGEVGSILHLGGAPHTSATWSHDVYTCTYDLPMGQLVLSVHVADSDARAQTYFADQRAEQPQAEDLVGLGEKAFQAADGTVTVVKDDMTLTVDATALPETFGDNGQKRSAFAFEVASQVMGCWTEHN